MNRISIGSDIGLLLIRRQANILTNWTLWNKLHRFFFNIKIQNFSFTKMHLKISFENGSHFFQGRWVNKRGSCRRHYWITNSPYRVHWNENQCATTVLKQLNRPESSFNMYYCYDYYYFSSVYFDCMAFQAFIPYFYLPTHQANMFSESLI